MIATAGMLIDYEIKHRESEDTKWRIVFQFSAVTWILLLVYQIIVFVSALSRQIALRGSG